MMIHMMLVHDTHSSPKISHIYCHDTHDDDTHDNIMSMIHIVTQRFLAPNVIDVDSHTHDDTHNHSNPKIVLQSIFPL